MKLLLIEDDPDLAEIILRSLKQENYLVETAGTFSQAREKTLIYDYDCVLLDLMLPGGSGLEVLREMKKRGKQAGVIILSAKDAIDDRVAGLDLGADDYLPKPFHLAELLARIKSVVRRRFQQAEPDVLRLGNVVLLTDTREAKVEGTPLALGRKEYDILHYFMQRPERMIDKQMLAEGVWGDSADQADNYDFVYAQMKNLRRRLAEAGANIEIKTVYGLGYRLSFGG